jgi:hypothetical protein
LTVAAGGLEVFCRLTDKSMLDAALQEYLQAIRICRADLGVFFCLTD